MFALELVPVARLNPVLGSLPVHTHYVTFLVILFLRFKISFTVQMWIPRNYGLPGPFVFKFMPFKFLLKFRPFFSLQFSVEEPWVIAL